MSYGPTYAIVFLDKYGSIEEPAFRHRRWPEGRASVVQSFFTLCGRSVFPEEGGIIYARPQTLIETCKECRRTPWLIRQSEEAAKRHRAITDPEELARIAYEYEALELSCTEIGRLHHVQKTTIKNYLVEQKVELRPKGGRNGANMVSPRVLAQIRFLYWDCGLSTSEVADVLGIPTGTVLSRMQKHGIPRRDKREASLVPWKRGIRKDAHKAKNYPNAPLSRPTLKAA